MKKLISLLVLCLGFLSASHAGLVTKGATWSTSLGGNGHTYYLVEFPYYSWDDATNDLFATVGPGYHLATITSQDEQDFLLDHLLYSSSPNADYFGEYWLGGYQFPVNTPGKYDNWVWVTGEAWSYTNWLPFEPNDQGGPGLEQHLGIKYFPSYSGWNDEGYYENIQGYIVESVPEPSSFILMAAGLAGLGVASRKRHKQN